MELTIFSFHPIVGLYYYLHLKIEEDFWMRWLWNVLWSRAVGGGTMKHAGYGSQTSNFITLGETSKIFPSLLTCSQRRDPQRSPTGDLRVSTHYALIEIDKSRINSGLNAPLTTHSTKQCSSERVQRPADS